MAVALLALLGIAGGAMIVAALPGADRPVVTAAPSEAAVATPTPGRRRPQNPGRADTEAAVNPRAPATPAPTALPAGEVSDLCEIFFDIPCGLGAGRYAPSRFRPAFDIELGDGWSNAVHGEDIVTLTRPEGAMTFAGRIARSTRTARRMNRGRGRRTSSRRSSPPTGSARRIRRRCGSMDDVASRPTSRLR